MADVALRDIRKCYDDVEVIHRANLEIADGEFVVFVGPSGCGKSTLLRMIAGLEEITSGTLEIGGRRCNDLPPSERGIAMVFQSYALYPHMSVYENMAFALKLARVDKAEIRQRVQRAADILQIEEYLQRKPKELSGGQRQRVAIGRAIVREPEVFLFDEPLSNLDAALRVQMRIEISKLHRQLKATSIYVTHDQVEAMTMADKIVVLQKGGVAQCGAPLELYNHPDNVFVAGFIGSPKMNFVNATFAAQGGDRDNGDSGSDNGDSDARDGDSNARIVLSDGTQVYASVDAARARKDQAVILGIRPEHLRIRQTETKGVTSFIPGRIALVEHLGEQTLIYVDTDALDELLVVRESGIVHAQPGDSVRVSVPAASSYLFDAGDSSAFPRRAPSQR